MSDTTRMTGHCLCGKVTIDARTVKPQVHACHCNMCRLWNGGPTMSVHCGTDVTFDNPESVSIYQSCDWAELGFCKHCGSHLFYRALESGEYILQTGSFEEQDKFVLEQQIFIDEKPAFYRFANQTTNLTGAEVVALYEAAQE